MAARKHHYVPVFYQKGFADREGRVWVYDRVRKVLQYLPPKVVCRAEDFYAVRPAGAPRDRRIETDILSPIEGLAAPVIKSVDARADLTQEDGACLCMFIGLQYGRVPSFARAVARAVEQQMQQMTRIQFANVERAAMALRDIEERTGKAVDVDPASVRCRISLDHLGSPSHVRFRYLGFAICVSAAGRFGFAEYWSRVRSAGRVELLPIDPARLS